MAASPTYDADVAVIGAGPSGAASALFAARSGRRVILLDAQAFPRDKPCGEGLMPTGRAPLRALGLEPVVANGAPCLIGIRIGAAGGSVATARFPTHAGHEAGLGVRRIEFDAQLVDAVSREPRIQFCQQVKAVDVRRQASGVTVMGSSGEIRAQQVAVADGLHSRIRHQLGWTRGPRRPHRYGIVGHWKIEAPLDPCVRISFTDGLEVYDGPVSTNQRMVALLCSQPRMRDFSGRLRPHYIEVARALRPELEQADLVGDVRAVGPFWYRASTVAADGIFLVGDAAGFTDPITAEGIGAGLRQAQAFAAALNTRNPERSYRLAHRRLTTNPRRIAGLFLRLTRTPALVERAVRSHEAAPDILPKLLGVGFGYWGFNRITPREWLRIFSGR